jgi:RNA polymerase sigma-70 factor, ECF subfamily
VTDGGSSGQYRMLRKKVTNESRHPYCINSCSLYLDARWRSGRGATAPPAVLPCTVGALPAPASSEHELIAHARAGSEDAFAELVGIHAERVYRALRRFGLDAIEAEDVAQEVFLRAWRNLARFEQRAQLSTWLYRIAFNEAQRRLARRPPPHVQPALDEEDAVSFVPAPPHLSPEARSLDREFETILERALSELPAEWRTAVVLRDIEGLSTCDAAAVVGVREAAFKSRLRRGRIQLRQRLEPYLQLEAD